jgi:hypothetical protein
MKGGITMRSMSENQVDQFLTFLKERIGWHYEKMAGTLSHHRVLIKTERAEVEVIRAAFLKILNEKG